jgi:hypothetical protein
MTTIEKLKINSPDIVSETIDGETVIVNLQTGDYYSLLRTATDIWSRIEKGTDRQSLISDLMQYYNASTEEISKAVNQFIEVLDKEGLITIEEIEKPKYQTPALKTLPNPLETPQFEWPEIEKFTDMEDLLLLDPIHEVEEETGWPNAKDAVA